MSEAAAGAPPAAKPRVVVLGATGRQGGSTLRAQNFEYQHLSGQISFTGKSQGEISSRSPR